MYVATYVRVSTVFEEQDSSLINQEEGLNDYIRRNGWVLFDTYSERQSSFKKRIEFQRLVKDAMARKFHVILVKSLSRFGRSIGELNTIVPQLVEKGLRFVALSEGIDTEYPDWQSKLAMYSMVYQMSSQTTSDWIRMAERARAKRGEFTGSFAPYGYTKVGKALVPADDDTPRVVQRIFDLHLEVKLGFQAIANLLTDEGIPSPAQIQGRKNASPYWHQTSIQLILKNAVYVGNLVAQRQHVSALGSMKRKRTPKEEHVILKDNHPPLISREQFQAVQNLIHRRSFRKVSGKPNLFSYLLFCADCGHGLYCVKRHYGNTHYICGLYQKRGAHHCSRHPIREKLLEDLILDDLKKFVGEHVDRKKLLEDMQNEARNEAQRAAQEIDALQKRIAKLEQRKNAAEDKWLDGEWNKERYHEALERLDKELYETRQRLNKLSRNPKIKLPDIAKLTSFDKLDRELVLLLVKRIEVHQNGNVTIIYNFTL
ncbi:MAG TPA: recombinase family protein [Paenibacillus sp.]|uniref:recombinase family protein n=1 Tax=Paenibacillus sp. TaxID=58172 RepID=UPI0028D2BEEC|nr:recombinase family protein [Paenibacillus sp.]HUC92099.1 recombinase family protein [Paenibacillus sp.]